MKRWLSLWLALFLTLSPVAYAQEEDGGLWYEDQAIALVQEMDALLKDEDYTHFVTAAETIISAVEPLKQSDFSSPPQSALRLTIPDSEALLAVLESMGAETEDLDCSELCLKAMSQRLPNALLSYLNSTEGAAWLAATSVYTTSETFVLPDGFQNAVVILRYEGDYWAAVGFTQTGEETGTATAYFIQSSAQAFLDLMNSALDAAGTEVVFQETVYD